MNTTNALRNSESNPIENDRSQGNTKQYDSNLMLTKSSQSISTLNWNSSHTSSMQQTTTLDALHFLHEYLENGNSDVLIDVLTKIAQEIKAVPFEKLQRSHSASNNNHHRIILPMSSHLRLSPTYHSNFQLSYNKDKKNKKEKADDKEKNEKKNTNAKKDEKTKKENADGTKKSTKKKGRVKQVEETTDTDVLELPSPVSPTRKVPSSPMTPSFSYVDTSGFPTLSVPVPHSTISTGSSPVSPDPSRVNLPPEQANGYSVAQLSQIQQQLQSDPPNSPLNKTSKAVHPHNMSIQEQLQSLSQMARDGDEILITLSVNALTQKQKTNNNNTHNHPPTPQPFQNNPYHSQTPWNNLYHQAMPPPSTAVIMPRNVEIVAKGFARVQNEHPQPPLPPSNLYTQQPMAHPHSQPPYAMMQPFYAPRFPMPCYSSSGPPQIPLGPPIQPMFGSSNMTMMAGGSTRPSNGAGLIPGMQNSFEDARNRLRVGGNSACDYLCQSSMYQPDFRGRPPPDAIVNGSVYNNNIISPQPMSFSAARYREKTNHSNSKRTKDSINEPLDFFHDNIHRTH